MVTREDIIGTWILVARGSDDPADAALSLERYGDAQRGLLIISEDGWMNAGFCLKNGYTLKKESPLVLRYLLLAHSRDLGTKELATVAERFSKRAGFTVRKSRRAHRQRSFERSSVSHPA